MEQSDRRRRPRFRLQIPGKLTLPGGEEKTLTPMSSKDISSGGIYLVSHSRVREGDRVELELSWRSDDDSGLLLRARGEVIRVEHLLYESFGLGVVFERTPELFSVNGDERKAENLGAPPLLNAEEINQDVFEYYPRLQKIRDYVEHNFSETITLKSTARVAAMERTYFCTFFHKKVGIPFSEWLRRTRIAKAILLMGEADHSITHIAFSVGFGDLRTFERAFKRYTHLTPLQFKKLLKPRDSRR